MPTPCPACGAPVERRHATGPTPIYCSQAHRKRHERAQARVKKAQHEAERLALLDVVAGLAASERTDLAEISAWLHRDD